MEKYVEFIQKKQMEYDMRTNVKPVYFHAPNFDKNKLVYSILVKYQKDSPYIFQPGAQLYSIFGAPAGCIWNGGTLLCGGVPLQEVKDNIDYYNYELGLHLTFTFTNPVITTPELINDSYANAIAEAGNNGNNFINVATSELTDHLQANYKNYKYCKSIVGSQFIPYDLSKYDISVLQRAKNNNWDFLNSISVEDRARIEILCNDPCPDDCPYIYSHYERLGKQQIKNEWTPDASACYNMLPFPFLAMEIDNKYYVSTDDLYNKYVPAGFQHFKFSGRMDLSRVLYGIATYMILPEFRKDVVMQILYSHEPI